MSVNIGSRAVGSTLDEALQRRVETAIHEALVHYHGRYEESLVDWFVALRLTVPEMAHPWQLTEVFTRLLDRGIIELQKPGVGPYSGDDEAFFLGGPFTAILTTRYVEMPAASNRQ